MGEKEIHIWEILEDAPYQVRLFLNSKFRAKLVKLMQKNSFGPKKMTEMINSSSYAKEKNVMISSARLWDWFVKNHLSMPLWVAMAFCEIFDLSLEEMEKNIENYRFQTKDHVCISKPKLPLKLDPIFAALIGHLLFDGYVAKDKRFTEYSQKNLEQGQNFVEKVQHCFGDSYIKYGVDSKGIPKIRIPGIIGKACKHVYGVDSFHTFLSYVPQTILNSSKDHKLAFLLSVIVDEGHVGTDYIRIQLSNLKLLNGLKTICSDLCYGTTEIKRHNATRYDQNPAYYFSINRIKKLFLNYLEITEKYPLLSLTFKSDSLSFLFETKFYESGRNTKDCKKQRISSILNILSYETLNSKQIAERLKINPKSIRRILVGMYRNNQLNRKKVKYAFIYFT